MNEKMRERVRNLERLDTRMRTTPDLEQFGTNLEHLPYPHVQCQGEEWSNRQALLLLTVDA